MDVGDLEPIEDYDTKEDEEKDMSEGNGAVHSEAGINGGGEGNLDQKKFVLGTKKGARSA